MTTQVQMQKVPAWKSPWVIGWLALVAVFLTANMVMIYLAIQTNPGLVVEDYYERGQDYERHMLTKLANDPGWHMNIDISRQPTAGVDVPLHFTILDKAGVPIEPETVTFYAYRPSDSSRDFSVPMTKEAKGLYSAKAKFRLKGYWDIMVSAKIGEEEYHAGHRIDVVAPE